MHWISSTATCLCLGALLAVSACTSGPQSLDAVRSDQLPAVGKGVVNFSVSAIQGERDALSETAAIRLYDDSALCLARNGFEMPPLPEFSDFSPEDLFDGLSEVEFAKQYGFGISTVERTSGDDVTVGDITSGAFVYDHSRTQEMATSADEFRVAYFGASALPFMEDFEFDPEDPQSGVLVDPSSCYGSALGAFNDSLEQLTDLGLLEDAASQVYAAFLADAVVVDSYARHAECLRQSGYEVRGAGPSAAPALVGERMAEVRAALAGTPSDLYNSDQMRMLQEMQDFERKLAQQSLLCEVPDRPKLADVYAAVEAAWLEEHPEILPLLVEG